MKLVKESLNNITHFERSNDPLVTLQVGKRALIENWLKEMKIHDYTIRDDYTIDVDNNLNISYNFKFSNFPDYIQFNRIEGYFSCSKLGLITLKGCPKFVGDAFYCSNNNLTSLKYGPIKVGEDYKIFSNLLTSLKY